MSLLTESTMKGHTPVAPVARWGSQGIKSKLLLPGNTEDGTLSAEQKNHAVTCCITAAPFQALTRATRTSNPPYTIPSSKPEGSTNSRALAR